MVWLLLYIGVVYDIQCSSSAVLDRIEDDWAFVADADVRNKLRTFSVLLTLVQFNPVDLALQLLDSSSAGKDVQSFRQTKEMLSRALKGSVDS